MKISNTSQRLKEIMRIKKLKQIDILHKVKPICEKYSVKMGSNDLSQYVTGKVEPSQKKLTVLAEALNVNEVWLMGYDVSMQPIEQKKTEEEQDEVYKKILKDNGLMDENDNINEEDFKKLIDFAVANKDFLIKKDKD